ncbi:MOB kinase activator 2-like [Paramacrobiotus metropolitanus]|uniref:MOB kinase activator 2-like n=1 Tax=Paramacrobiotus metropolitanus TaxID=2943436 RepID=UPI002445B929|nr:MOB kinase activator 2-like [Paramacrobiotus metropolitanus]XP_055331139.1 MOB kinase activator 2-like [Paramacrobiotus metropolitanus]XP_055331146.1 MOB kinase activator 2-like [Paramacrobiotus metropolitanus]XP_055331156.1 MOB kinase activator 2-like [Paramacrobiotus metropolitanus]
MASSPTASEDKDVQEKQLPSTSRPFSERFGFGYFRDTLDWFTGKGRKKEKNDGSGDATSTPTDDSTKLYLNRSLMQRFIQTSQLRQIICLPSEIELSEWLASQIIPFFNNVNLLYGTISEFCTQSTCPTMSAPNNTIYYWIDEKGKKSKCSAVQYIDYVTASIERLMRDVTVFPARHGMSFPSNFDTVIRRIQRQLLHVLAHMYHAHFDAHVQLGTHVYLNSVFVHFVIFSQHFGLIEARELDVLRDLAECLLTDVESGNEKEPAPPSESPLPGDSTGISHEEVDPETPLTAFRSWENSKSACDRKPVNPTAPLNVKDLLWGNALETSVV